MNQPSDPWGNFNFRVEIEGVQVGAFSQVEGLGMSIEEIEYQDGTHLWPRKRPGRKKFNNIKLKKGLVGRDTLFRWMMDTMNGSLERKSGSVILLDDTGDANEAVMRFNFFEAWPKSWDGIRFDASAANLQVEELELVIEYLQVEGGKQGERSR